MTLADRLAERKRQLRTLNLARPPSPATDLARALEEDQRRAGRRQALRAAGLPDADTAERIQGRERDVPRPRARLLPPDLQEPIAAVQEPPGATFTPPGADVAEQAAAGMLDLGTDPSAPEAPTLPPEPEAGPRGSADAASASPAPGGPIAPPAPEPPESPGCGCDDRQGAPLSHPESPMSDTHATRITLFSPPPGRNSSGPMGGVCAGLRSSKTMYGVEARLVSSGRGVVEVDTPDPKALIKVAQARGWTVQIHNEASGFPHTTGITPKAEPPPEASVPAPMMTDAPTDVGRDEALLMFREAHERQKRTEADLQVLEYQVRRIHPPESGDTEQCLKWIISDLLSIAGLVEPLYPAVPSHSLLDRVGLLVEEVRRHRRPPAPAPAIPVFEGPFRIPIRVELELHVLPPTFRSPA